MVHLESWGIGAPLTIREAQLILATETARAANSGQENPFDAATHIRIGICRFKEEPPELANIVRLSEKAKRVPRPLWGKLGERELGRLHSLRICRSASMSVMAMFRQQRIRRRATAASHR